MPKVKFRKIGFAKKGISKKKVYYLRLFLNVDDLKRMTDKDLAEKIFIFNNQPEAYQVYAPVKEGG